MKVLHVTAIISLDGKSGIPSVVKGLCEYQNHIIDGQVRVMSLRAPVDKVGSSYFDFVNKKNYFKYIREYSPDIVIIHDFYYYQYALLGRILHKLHIPFLLEPHGAFGIMAQKKSCVKKTIANHTLFRQLFKLSSGIIYTNEGEKSDAFLKSKNDVVIPNGVEISSIENNNNKNFVPGNEPIFYYLGRYDINHKGLDYLFDALDLLELQGEHITVNLYGIGSENEVNYVHNRISQYKNMVVEDKGPIYDEKKIATLRRVNILLLTSRYEGSPMTILDALSFGNPCLITPGTNVTKEIRENKIGWVTELDANLIADCILYAKEDYKKNHEYYYNSCKQYVLNNCLWDKIAAQSLNAYKQFTDI